MPNHVFLGFDFGMRRIGVAVGQTLTHSAKPIAVLKARHGLPRWEAIQTLIDTWAAEGLVIGIPYDLDGTEQPMTVAACQFVHELQSRFKLPVYTIDERLTTVDAKRHRRYARHQQTE